MGDTFGKKAQTLCRLFYILHMYMSSFPGSMMLNFSTEIFNPDPVDGSVTSIGDLFAAEPSTGEL